ncbi:MlaA family lipoprotein [Megalodesulfovibrio paquesii]
MHTATRLLALLLLCLAMSFAFGCSAKQPAAPKDPAATAPAPDTPATQATAPAAPAEPAPAPGTGDDNFFGDESAVVVVYDPLEPWNRFWFSFNDYFYQGVMQPLGKTYNAVTPKELRTGIRNMYHNILFPVRFINSILQGKFKAAGVQMARFVGNTAFGLGGFFDYFDRKKSIVPAYDEDFGQTLATWGVGDGFYLVVPIFGPTTLRDGFGTVADLFADPVSYLNPWPLYLGYEPCEYWVGGTIRGVTLFNDATFTLDEYDRFKQAAVEPYSAMRDAYIQNRKVEIGR